MHSLTAMVDRRILLPGWFIGAILLAAAGISECRIGAPTHYLSWVKLNLLFALPILVPAPVPRFAL
jgi:hypothetical protein